MTDSTTKRPPLVKVLTPRGIAKFPYLNKPDTKFNADGEYRIRLILTADAAAPIVAKLEAAAQKAYADAQAELTEKAETEKGEKKAKAKKALAELKRGDLPAKPVYDEDGNETGQIELGFKMRAARKVDGVVKAQRPKLFDAKGNEFPASIDIWGGSTVKVAGAVNPFYMPGTNTAGVGLRLSAVQIIKLNQGGGSTADSYGFGTEDDGYEVEDDAARAGFKDEVRGAGGESSADQDDF